MTAVEPDRRRFLDFNSESKEAISSYKGVSPRQMSTMGSSELCEQHMMRCEIEKLKNVITARDDEIKRLQSKLSVYER